MSLFPRLFVSGQIGTMKLKNRLVMPPMGTSLADVNGAVTDRLINYYVERAKGGVGLIIVENTLVNSKYGIQITNQLRIDDYKYIPQLYELTETVHSYNAKVAIQINSAGSGMRPHLSPGILPVAPSSVKVDFQTLQSQPLTCEQIRNIVLDFGKGAKLAKLAGFDAVEIHGAHGYLISQFLSPYFNRRSDIYGGCFEGRLSFCLEVIKEVRREVGLDFPILFRMSVDEFLGDQGITITESIKIAQEIEKAGVDAIDLSAGNLNMARSCTRAIPSVFVNEGHLVDFSKLIKDNVNIPVIVAGKIKDPDLAEKILLEGKADYIAIGRGLISDPELPLKSYSGLKNEIRKCISCNDMCIYRKTWLSHPIRCTVNPTVGREGKPVGRALQPKRIAIIGGGPAGMEAARIAALRGHRVTLYERGSALGGQLRMAGLLPIKKDIKDYIDYLISQLNKLNVQVYLNHEVTVDSYDKMEFDDFIVATGAIRYTPNLKGAQNKNVLYYDDVLLGLREISGENVIVTGGGMIGCETALYLAEIKNKRVNLITRQTEVGSEVEPIFTRSGLIDRFQRDNITIFAECEIDEIFENHVRVKSRGQNKLLEMDGLIIAHGRRSNNYLSEYIEFSGKSAYSIGDCVIPRKLAEAVHEGFSAGLRV